MFDVLFTCDSLTLLQFGFGLNYGWQFAFRGNIFVVLLVFLFSYIKKIARFVKFGKTYS